MTKVTQISFEGGAERGQRRIHLREISDDSEAPLGTVGQDLRAARLRRGDDLATVSRSLKIRKDHLEAVEEDNFAGLPGKTYAIGFVRSYSGYLGLDAAATVERYKQEISGRHEDHVPADPGFHAEEARRLPYGWRIVAGFVGLAMIYGVWHLVSAGPAAQPVPPAPALTAPRPRVAAAQPAPPPPASDAVGDSATPPPANDSAAQAATPPAPPVAGSASLTSGSNASAPTKDVAQPAPAVPSVPGDAQADQTQVYGAQNVNPHVVLRAHGDTRLTVRGDDGSLYLNRDLHAGDSYQVPAKTGLFLATSDAGALDIILDGTDIGKLGQNQQILGRVSLDPQSLVDRYKSH